jgi:hypothetical protein
MLFNRTDICFLTEQKPEIKLNQKQQDRLKNKQRPLKKRPLFCYPRFEEEKGKRPKR